MLSKARIKISWACMIDSLFYIVAMFQDIIRPLSNPIKKTGHIQILYGNVAPEGSVAKITGKEGMYFCGKFTSLGFLVTFTFMLLV